MLRTSDVFKSSLSFRRFSKSFLNSEILLARFIFSDSRFSKHCMNPNLSSSFALSSDSSSPSRKRRISCNQKQYRFETCFKIRFRFNKIYSQSSNAPHFIKKERIISLIFKEEHCSIVVRALAFGAGSPRFKPQRGKKFSYSNPNFHTFKSEESVLGN